MISWVVPVSPSRGKIPSDAVDVSLWARICHGVHGQGDVEPAFVGLACGRLDTEAGGDASDHDLRNIQVLQVLLQARIPERSPLLLCHRVVARLLVKLRDQIGPPCGKLAATATCSLRPDGAPPTFTSTTGRFWPRTASPNALARFTTSSSG